MGGVVLEWLLCSSPECVKRIVPLAAFARNSVWYEEAQRQSIYNDAEFGDGDYGDMQPETRTTVLLTHGRRDSFEDQFGRKPQPQPPVVNGLGEAALTPPEGPTCWRTIPLLLRRIARDTRTQHRNSPPYHWYLHLCCPSLARECHPNNQSSQPNPASASNTPNS